MINDFISVSAEESVEVSPVGDTVVSGNPVDEYFSLNYPVSIKYPFNSLCYIISYDSTKLGFNSSNGLERAEYIFTFKDSNDNLKIKLYYINLFINYDNFDTN